MKKLAFVLFSLVVLFSACKKDNTLNEGKVVLKKKTIYLADVPSIPVEVKGIMNFTESKSVTFASGEEITFSTDKESTAFVETGTDMEFIEGGTTSPNFTTTPYELGYSCGNALNFVIETADTTSGQSIVVQIPASHEGVSPYLFGRYVGEDELYPGFLQLNTDGTGSIESDYINYITCANDGKLNFRWGALLDPNCTPFVFNIKIDFDDLEDSKEVLNLNIYFLLAKPDNCPEEYTMFLIFENVDTHEFITLLPPFYMKR